MMSEYRKKPVIIEAVQFTGDNYDKCLEFTGLEPSDGVINNSDFIIQTLEGVMTASKNDWIIKGIKGEFYPCKPDIFEATYEEVTERNV